VVALAALLTLGAERLAASSAPLEEVVATAGWPWAAPVVRVGAALASLGALLALLAGVGRTTLAMARTGDLPRALAAVSPRTQVPHRAEIALAVAVCIIVAVADVRGAIGFSSFGVLVYYLIANASALRQPVSQRRYPRALAVVGVIGCVALVVTLPWLSVTIGAGVLVLGMAWRWVINRRAAPNS
jgi:APA family basic amino acid/polyamine antiporter